MLGCPRKMGDRELTSKERNLLQAWKRFVRDENGAVPSTIVAMLLGMSTSGVYQAGQRGWLKFFSVGRDRWYGAKSVAIYREKRRSGGNWDTFRAGAPRDCSETGTDAFGDWNPLEK